MHIQGTQLAKSFWAFFALEISKFFVNTDNMSFKVAWFTKSLSTKITSMIFQSFVNKIHVFFQFSGCSKCFIVIKNEFMPIKKVNWINKYCFKRVPKLFFQKLLVKHNFVEIKRILMMLSFLVFFGLKYSWKYWKYLA